MPSVSGNEHASKTILSKAFGFLVTVLISKTNIFKKNINAMKEIQVKC